MSSLLIRERRRQVQDFCGQVQERRHYSVVSARIPCPEMEPAPTRLRAACDFAEATDGKSLIRRPMANGIAELEEAIASSRHRSQIGQRLFPKGWARVEKTLLGKISRKSSVPAACNAKEALEPSSADPQRPGRPSLEASPWGGGGEEHATTCLLSWAGFDQACQKSGESQCHKLMGQAAAAHIDGAGLAFVHVRRLQSRAPHLY